MVLSIGRKIAAGFLVALIALVAIGTVAQRNFRETTVDARWVTHTVEVLLKVEAVSAELKDSEASARGYFIGGDAQALENFKTVGEQINRDVDELATLVSDNPRQVARLQRLRTLIVSRRLNSQTLIDSHRNGNGDVRATTQIVDQGDHLGEQINALISEVRQEERGLLSERQTKTEHMVAFTSGLIIYGTLSALLLVILVGFLITQSIIRPIRLLQAGATALGSGNYDHRVKVKAGDEVGQLAGVFNQMADQVQARQRLMADQDWLKTSLTDFARLLEGQRDLPKVGQIILSELAQRLSLPQLTFYCRRTGETELKLLAAYAVDRTKARLAVGEGLAGQCVAEGKRIILTSIPGDYLVSSSLGAARPTLILLQPIRFEENVKAVLEAASFRPLTELQLTLIERLAESLGIILATIEASQRTEELLKQSQVLAATLQRSQTELSEKNAELESQTDELQKSEALLQQQQEELRQSNEEMQQTNEELRQTTEELEEKASLLTEQKREMERSNRDLEEVRARLEGQTETLELTSKYKSDFLANMSHELRTPLNSLLILSKMLADNPDKNLTEKQVQYAKTVQSSGHDLLELINDILDLSKIEAGKMDLDISEVRLSDLRQFAESTFLPVAETKKLGFTISLDPGLPKTIATDRRRLEQIIKNLLSNAFKFTEKGSVDFSISAVIGSPAAGRPGVLNGSTSIAFAIADTGIGISEEKRQIIFEAFRQADAGTARRFGGTGLGLSISRELARLLGGAIELQSESGKGSTFTLLIPTAWKQSAEPTVPRARPPREAAIAPRAAEIEVPTVMAMDGLDDDRGELKPGDLVLLIIEDDKNFARLLMEFARDKKFKAVVARTAAQGMALALAVKPAAITLDLHLPDQDGWVVIDWLKHHPQMRHIPVHIISVDEERERSLRLGAVSYLQKPVTREALDNALNDTVSFLNRTVKELLVIEDDVGARQAMIELIGNGDVHTTAVGSGAEALAELEKKHFDCLVLDLGLPDISGTALLKEIHERMKDRAPPVIVYTGKDLSRSEETELRLNAESIILKSVRSPERLLDETALFLHRIQSNLPDAKRRLIEQGQKNDPVLVGRKVLVVDDDVRNIFAITSALESHQMNVLYAESGKGALDTLQKNPDVDVILMDVMMPEMDGFEAIREIRKIDRFKRTPIISVTAKAMKGDREKCLEAGASDYIAKPVDMDKLRSLLRVWLYR